MYTLHFFLLFLFSDRKLIFQEFNNNNDFLHTTREFEKLIKHNEVLTFKETILIKQNFSKLPWACFPFHAY